MQLLTDSACKSFRTCPRKYLYAYELGRRARRGAGPLGFGHAVHEGLEALWLGHDWSAALAESGLDPFGLTAATAMLEGYVARWGDPREQFEVLGVELQFDIPMVNPSTGAPSKTWRHGGTLDALVRRDGEVWVVEHKTSSEDITPGSTYWQRLRLDSQVSGYLRAARSLGHEPAGVLYDVLGKPGLRPHRATPVESRKFTKDGRLYANQRELDETADEFHDRLLEAIAADPDKHYQRGEVVRLEDEADEAAADLWMVGRAIRESQLLRRWPRNPGSCIQWSRVCEFFGVCTGAASIEDDTIYETKERNPELCQQTA